MMQAVILWRNTQNGQVGFISSDDDNIAVFADRDEAIELAENHHLLRAFPYQVVELDEL